MGARAGDVEGDRLHPGVGVCIQDGLAKAARATVVGIGHDQCVSLQDDVVHERPVVDIGVVAGEAEGDPDRGVAAVRREVVVTELPSVGIAGNRPSRGEGDPIRRCEEGEPVVVFLRLEPVVKRYSRADGVRQAERPVDHPRVHVVRIVEQFGIDAIHPAVGGPGAPPPVVRLVVIIVPVILAVGGPIRVVHGP